MLLCTAALTCLLGLITSATSTTGARVPSDVLPPYTLNNAASGAAAGRRALDVPIPRWWSHETDPSAQRPKDMQGPVACAGSRLGQEVGPLTRARASSRFETDVEHCPAAVRAEPSQKPAVFATGFVAVFDAVTETQIGYIAAGLTSAGAPAFYQVQSQAASY